MHYPTVAPIAAEALGKQVQIFPKLAWAACSKLKDVKLGLNCSLNSCKYQMYAAICIYIYIYFFRVCRVCKYTHIYVCICAYFLESPVNATASKSTGTSKTPRPRASTAFPEQPWIWQPCQIGQRPTPPEGLP